MAVSNGRGQAGRVVAPQVGSARCWRGRAQSSKGGSCDTYGGWLSLPHAAIHFLDLIHGHVSFLSARTVNGCIEHGHVETLYPREVLQDCLIIFKLV